MHLISPEELASAIADRLARQPAVLVALDGRCGSGKTTLSAQLAERFPQSITVHTDDFYLPPEENSLPDDLKAMLNAAGKREPEEEI